MHKLAQPGGAPAAAPATGMSARRRAASEEDQPDLRVMHVMYEFTPGGMEFGVVKLVNRLQPKGLANSICSTRRGASMQSLVAPGVRVFELDRRDGNDPRLVWQLYRLLRRERPDIVHTHSWGTLIEGLAAARLARVKAVVHGEHGTLQLRSHQRWMQRYGWGFADRVLSVSARLSEKMARETGFPLARITTIRNGVDLARFARVDRRAARADLGLPAEAFVVGTVGRLVTVKDQATLLRAISLLVPRSGPRATVVLAGEGPLKDQLLAQARALGLGEDVRLLGHRDDVERVLAALDVFVLSSVSEGMPNTVLEAMASRQPVISTRVGGAEEVVVEGQTGMLIAPGDAEALARGIERLRDAPALRSAMAAAGRERVEREFSLERTIHEYEAMYRQLVPGRAR